jgi:prepilin-type N-terminal cleavage/methylation domain-containing protein
MKKLRRDAFTLIEIMVVMLIMTLALTVTGIQVTRFLKEQHFLNDVSHVIRSLQSAQDLMMVLNLDIQLKMTHNPKEQGIVYEFALEKKAQKSWEKIIERPNKALKYLSSIVYVAPDGYQETSDLGITLNFPAGGVNMTKGTLILRGGPSGMEKKISLKGYPYPFDTKYQEASSVDPFEERREDESFKHVLMELLGPNREEKK